MSNDIVVWEKVIHLAFHTQGQMQKHFEEATYALEVGYISDVVSTNPLVECPAAPMAELEWKFHKDIFRMLTHHEWGHRKTTLAVLYLDICVRTLGVAMS